jgi:hypothetical protein
MVDVSIISAASMHTDAANPFLTAIVSHCSCPADQTGLLIKELHLLAFVTQPKLILTNTF